MCKRDAEYKVCDMVELDEGFFSTEVPDTEKDKPLKRGHGSQKKTRVLMLAGKADTKSYTNFKSLVKEHFHQVIEPAHVGKILPCSTSPLAMPNGFCWMSTMTSHRAIYRTTWMISAISSSVGVSVTLCLTSSWLRLWPTKMTLGATLRNH